MLFLIVFGIFVVVGFLVALLLSSIGDWRRLAKRFRASHKPSGQTMKFRSAAVGVVSYGNILTVCVAEEGLYLALFFPFRLMHPPLLIPWDEFTGVRENKFLARTTYRFSIGSPEWASMTIQERLMQEIKAGRAALQSNS